MSLNRIISKTGKNQQPDKCPFVIIEIRTKNKDKVFVVIEISSPRWL